MTQKPVRLVCNGCSVPFRAGAKVRQPNVVAMAINSGWLVPESARTTNLTRKELAEVECYCRACNLKGRVLSNGGNTFTDSVKQERECTATP